ncbi:GNAT family N-acetyltransferase [Herbidospora sp. NBRC 101105]|uniref:bifunctional acetate--CoA ligase family protein/GNAT family N-acetyltransferase n=1 Tax=Herbidospora sp. NBRC 101105 TaxID=3032195 RepID=UPI0024A0BCBE|nr:GNAT family N-acetyltransferase [Herbidospora sp. NBRC 101105]GLX99521.1 acyl-CoA synthetase [Herbidospora sp. NBRC 101105]
MSDECDVLLRDGGIAHIRPLGPGDVPELHELVERVSEKSAYLRFFTGGRATAHAYMDAIARPGHHGRVLVALVAGRLAAVAEYIPDADGAADLGVLVDDALHGTGLGTLLIEHLALAAAAEGVTRFVADVLTENKVMLDVLSHVGLPVEITRSGPDTRVIAALTAGSRLAGTIAARDHEAERASLRRVLEPRAVAVVGAGRDPGSVGHKVLRNLIDGGFPGTIYPVNPHADEIAGWPAYPSLAMLPERVDVVVVAVPAKAVPDVARDCAATGVRGLVVLSAGFAEHGGKDAERELLTICRTAGMRLIGPNCLGIVNTAAHLNASFLRGTPEPGGVAVLSQSGAVGAVLLDRLPISSFVSVGNKADVSGNDLLEYWEDDETTRVIALYLESFGNPRRFARIAARVGRRKPVLLVKSGRSEAGDRAVRSHTAAAATPDIAVDALVRAAGVIRLDSIRDMYDTARLLETQPLPAGRRVAIVGNSGGPEAMTADVCERAGLTVPALDPGAELRRRFPSAALGNPVDLGAEASAEDIGLGIESALADPGVDVVLAVYTPPFGSGAPATKEAIAKAAREARKPVIACILGEDGLIDGRVPSYAYPEQAVQALARVVHYTEWRNSPAEEVETGGFDDLTARALLTGQAPEGWLDPHALDGLLRHFGIPLVQTISVSDAEAAAEASAALGGPVVLKAVGPVHKSDVGGVRVGLTTPEETRAAFVAMRESIGAEMTGAVVQPMVEQGTEIIVGGVNYPAFGPLVMVGMGGVTADLLADRAFRVPPFSAATAEGMIRELRSHPVLYGYRGRPPADAQALAEVVRRVGLLMDALPEVAELDLNPVIVTPGGAVAVDARIRLAPAGRPPSPFIRRLR